MNARRRNTKREKYDDIPPKDGYAPKLEVGDKILMSASKYAYTDSTYNKEYKILFYQYGNNHNMGLQERPRWSGTRSGIKLKNTLIQAGARINPN